MRRFLILFAMLSLIGSSLAGENWPQFRGSHGDNRADEAKPPRTWSEKHNIVWKTAIHDKGW